MLQIYSLDHSADEFFTSQSSVTRQECDDMAINLLGEPINPTPILGTFSYTVTAGPVIRGTNFSP